MSNYNKITALYSRLSVGDEDRDGGESNSMLMQSISKMSMHILYERTFSSIFFSRFAANTIRPLLML